MQQRFYLWSGDRVVFYGDSITEQQLYTVFVETFVRTRFPELDVKWFNRGWGGDTCWGQGEGGTITERAHRDVAPLDATVLTVLFGMNDGGYVPYNEHTGQLFADEYDEMLGELTRAAPHARFTLARTSPWDQYTNEPRAAYSGAPYPPRDYNEALLKYGETVATMAEKYGHLYVDFNAPMVDVMRRGKGVDLAMATQIVPDWIHPSPAGHLIMAAELLKSWHAPGLVSRVVLDADGGDIDHEGTSIERRGKLSWMQEDFALPFPLFAGDPAIGFVRSIYPFNNDLNVQTLSVKKLEEGQYDLRINAELVGKFTANELDGGIDLAALATPMTHQSERVYDLVARRSMLQMTRWRQVEFRYGHEGEAAEAIRGLTALEKQVEDQAKAASHPVMRHFEIIKSA